MARGWMIAAAIAIVVSAVGFAATRDCRGEDSGQITCTWYADRQGNGKGDTFTRLAGVYVYWSRA